LSFSRYTIIISFSLERKALKIIDFLDRFNSFPGVLLPEIGANGVQGIVIDIREDGRVGIVETQNARFWLFGADF